MQLNEYCLGVGGFTSEPGICPPNGATVVSDTGTASVTHGPTDRLLIICNSDGTMDVVYGDYTGTGLTNVVFSC